MAGFMGRDSMTIQTGMSWLNLLAAPPSSPFRHAVSYPSSPPSFLHDLSRNPQHNNSSSARSVNRNLSANNGFPLRTCGNDGAGVLHSHARIHMPSLNRHAAPFPPFLRDLSRNPKHSNSSSMRLCGRNLSANNGFPLRSCGNDEAGVFYGK